jgi:hypothetical protein
MSRRARRHAAQREPRRTPAPVRLLLGALGTAGAIVLGVLAGGGTYAAWSVAAPAAAATTLHTGSASLTTTGLQLNATGLYPGLTAYAPTTVRNTGTTPLALALDPAAGPATPTPFSASVIISAAQVASAGDCTAGRVPAGATTRVGASAAADLRVTLSPGASALVCIGVGMPHDAPAIAAGAAASALALTISGTQVRP